MKTLTTLALGACLATAFAGAGFAQSSMSSMSASDKAMMTKCQGMSESMMKADKDCMDMMKKNPDMMKGTTGSSASGTNNASPGSPSKTMPSNQK